MPVPLHTPRVNTNDDNVRVAHFFVSPGTFVRRGDPIADIETDKATFTVEAEQDAYLLSFSPQVGETVEVGSVLAWMGASADEAVPSAPAPASAPQRTTTGAPTLKAALLLAQYGIAARDVPASGERLSAQDVERFIASKGPRREKGLPESASARPVEPGKVVQLTPPEHGMLRTVAWHKSEAVAAYLELSYDPAPWNEYSAAFQTRQRLLFSPLLSLIAWGLVRAVIDQPSLNATIIGEQRYQYDHVNAGFTVQSGNNLIAVVVREAEKLDEAGFVNKLGELQRKAMGNTLRPEEVSGATVGFSSMARWAVTRHVPVLLPHTALMIAHTAAANGAASLGATYDHRVLNGAEVVRVLQKLVQPPAAGNP